MPRGYPGSTPAVDPRSQGVIPRRFKRKKFFVTNGRKEGRTDHSGREVTGGEILTPSFYAFCRLLRP